MQVLEGVRDCGGAHGADTKPSTCSTLTPLTPKSWVMSPCPHCRCRLRAVGQEPARGSGHPSAALGPDDSGDSPSVPCWPSAGAGAAPAGVRPWAGSPQPTGEVTGQRWALPGTLKTASQKHASSHSLIFVLFLLKYSGTGQESICCNREKSV